MRWAMMPARTRDSADFQYVADDGSARISRQATVRAPRRSGAHRTSPRGRCRRRSQRPRRSAIPASSRRRCRSADAARPAASRWRSNRAEAEEHARAILGMDIRGLTVYEVWIEGASEIASEYYASVIFDRSAKAPLVMLSTKGGMDIEAVADEDPDAIARLHVDPLLGFQDFHGRRLAFEAASTPMSCAPSARCSPSCTRCSSPRRRRSSRSTR